MNLKIQIKRTSDGVIATDVWRDWKYHQFWWEEGNAGCDCNRELFFLRARGENDDVETKCGEARFSVRLEDADTGKLLYEDTRNG